MSFKVGEEKPVEIDDLNNAFIECGVDLSNSKVLVTRWGDHLSIKTGGGSDVPGAKPGFVLLGSHLPKDLLSDVIEVCQDQEWACGFTFTQALTYVKVFIIGSEQFGEQNGDPLQNEGYKIGKALYIEGQTPTSQIIAALKAFVQG